MIPVENTVILSYQNNKFVKILSLRETSVVEVVVEEIPDIIGSDASSTKGQISFTNDREEFEILKFAQEKELIQVIDSNLRSQLIEQISSNIYQRIVALTSKVVTTLPMIMYTRHQENKNKELEKNKRLHDEAEKKAEQKKCAKDATRDFLGVDDEQATVLMGSASEDGSHVSDIEQGLKKAGHNGVETKDVKLAIEDITQFMDNKESDRCILSLSREEGELGHSVYVEKDSNGVPHVVERDKKIPLSDYLEENKEQFKGAKVTGAQGCNKDNHAQHQQKAAEEAKKQATETLRKTGQVEGPRFGLQRNPDGSFSFELNDLPNGQINLARPDFTDTIRQIPANGGSRHHILDSDTIRTELADFLNDPNIGRQDKIETINDFLNHPANNLVAQDFNNLCRNHLANNSPLNNNDVANFLCRSMHSSSRNLILGSLSNTRLDDPNNPHFQHYPTGDPIDYGLLSIGNEDRLRNFLRTSRNIFETMTFIHNMDIHNTQTQPETCTYNGQHTWHLKPADSGKSKRWGVDISHPELGLNISDKNISIDYWLNYDEEALENILEQRSLHNKSIDTQNINIFKTLVIAHEYSNYFNSCLSEIIQEINQLLNTDNQDMKAILPILISQSAYVSHWVSMIVEKVGKVIKITYIDSENQPMPTVLQKTLIQQLGLIANQNIVFNQPILETQRYNNCGPELVENFVYYLTGTRATQESAVYLHSLLYENSLLDPEFSAPQITENNRLIAEFSNQMRPIYHMPGGGYITSEYTLLMSKLNLLRKLGNYVVKDAMILESTRDIQVKDKTLLILSDSQDNTNFASDMLLVHEVQTNDDKLSPSSNIDNSGENIDENPYSATTLYISESTQPKAKKTNYELAESMLNMRNGIEFIPAFSYFVKEVAYPITKDIVPERLANAKLPEISSGLLYLGHVGTSYVGAIALNVASPLTEALEASAPYASRIVFKEVLQKFSSVDLSDNINMAGYCLANTAFHFLPELLKLNRFFKHGQFELGGRVVGESLTATSLSSFQRLTISSLECYSTYKQVHNLEDNSSTKIANIVPYIADSVVTVASLAITYNPFFVIGNIVATDISTKIILKAIPTNIKTNVDMVLGCLGVADDISSTLTNIYDTYWQGIDNKNSINSYKSCKTLFDSLMQFNWLNNVYDFSLYSSYYTNKVIRILDNEKNQEAKENQNVLSEEFGDEKAEYIFKYISKPGLDIKYNLLKQAAFGVITESEYQEKLQKTHFPIDIGDIHYDLCVSLNKDTNEDNNRPSYNCYSKENDIIDHIITDGAKRIELYHLYSE